MVAGNLSLTTRVTLCTSWPPQEAINPWPPFLQYNKRLLRQKTGGASLYMPLDGHWLASFEVIPPKVISFSAQSRKKKLFRLFLSGMLSRRCRLSRTTSDPAQKVESFRPKLCFSCFSGERIGTILSRRSRLSRTSRAPARLIRPRPIDCDRES